MGEMTGSLIGGSSRGKGVGKIRWPVYENLSDSYASVYFYFYFGVFSLLLILSFLLKIFFL